MTELKTFSVSESRFARSLRLYEHKQDEGSVKSSSEIRRVGLHQIGLTDNLAEPTTATGRLQHGFGLAGGFSKSQSVFKSHYSLSFANRIRQPPSIA